MRIFEYAGPRCQSRRCYRPAHDTGSRERGLLQGASGCAAAKCSVKRKDGLDAFGWVSPAPFAMRRRPLLLGRSSKPVLRAKRIPSGHIKRYSASKFSPDCGKQGSRFRPVKGPPVSPQKRKVARNRRGLPPAGRQYRPFAVHSSAADHARPPNQSAPRHIPAAARRPP